MARRLGEKGRVADPALLPFLCYSTVPKCRPGDASRSNLRPCKEACTQLEVTVWVVDMCVGNRLQKMVE